MVEIQTPPGTFSHGVVNFPGVLKIFIGVCVPWGVGWRVEDAFWNNGSALGKVPYSMAVT
jgi:hypothetical protein